MNVCEWDGKIIIEFGVYLNILLEDYYNNLVFLDGFSVFKFLLKYIFCLFKGSFKQFWMFWVYNLDYVVLELFDVFNFGKVMYVFLLGDEVFVEKFVICFVEFKDYRKQVVQDWKKVVLGFGKIFVMLDDIEKICCIVEDVVCDLMVQQGILNGLVEWFMFLKDEKIGFWFRFWLDNLVFDGFWVDLKIMFFMDFKFIQC